MPYPNDSSGLELEKTVYALDATTIDLCPSVFPWAYFRRIREKSSSTPLKTLDIVLLKIGAFYNMELGSLDFAPLYTVSLASTGPSTIRTNCVGRGTTMPKAAIH